MNTRKTQFSVLLLLFTCLFFTQCTKEGPPGPKGEVNMNAYVFTATSWGLDNNDQWYATASIPDLTSTNINEVAVLAYFKPINAWRALPYTHIASTNYFMGYNHFVGGIDFIWTYNGIGSGDDPNYYFNTNVQFKVVIIPADQRYANPDLDWDDYEAVKKRFNLKEEPIQSIQ